MRIGQLRKFHRFVFHWENYLLLARVLQSATMVRFSVGDRSATPPISAILPLVNDFYLEPQPNWRISDARKIAWFASFIINFPFHWGRCVQRSLIVYRLLNGYGFPARLIIGIEKEEPTRAGHVWVSRISDGREAFAEASDPTTTFLPVYTSPLPG